jgi:glycosyltransferase involved in cell wall biosynthesis
MRNPFPVTRQRVRNHPPTDQTPPIFVGDLDLDQPLPGLNADLRFEAARLLVRLHQRPMGEVTVELEKRPLHADDLAKHVWLQLGDSIAAHCADDGMPSPDGLSGAGLTRPAQPPCVQSSAEAPKPAITVVVATHNRTDSLLRCLESLSRTDYEDFDVIVVDSAPATDETEATLAQRPAWRFPLTYVRLEQPGLALAHNAALDKVTGKFVAITDDDTEVAPNWLTAIAQAFADTGATCVTGLILPAELETPGQLLVEETWGFGRGFARRVFSLDEPEGDPVFPFSAGRFGSGANMAFRADWLNRHGFDPATGAGTPARGGDDLVAFLNVITDGKVLVYEPNAAVRHWHRREWEVLHRQAFSYGIGFSAYFAASIAARPALLAAMLNRVVPAIRYRLKPRSRDSVAREPSGPAELRWRVRAGILAGPVAYALSRWRHRAVRHRAVPGRVVNLEERR